MISPVNYTSRRSESETLLGTSEVNANVHHHRYTVIRVGFKVKLRVAIDKKNSTLERERKRERVR